jgi:hypothetical protein
MGIPLHTVILNRVCGADMVCELAVKSVGAEKALQVISVLMNQPTRIGFTLRAGFTMERVFLRTARVAAALGRSLLADPIHQRRMPHARGRISLSDFKAARDTKG